MSEINGVLKGLDKEVGDEPTVLILGSFPGQKSLEVGEYYANPNNKFWGLMEAIVDVPQDLKYSDRIEGLKANGIALWDVIETCEREGSLDGKIRNAQANDIASLLKQFPTIKRIVFNGRKARKVFDKTVSSLPADIVLADAPSTSPARAMKTEDRIAAWRQAIEH